MKLKNILSVIILGVIVWVFANTFNRVDPSTSSWKRYIYRHYLTVLSRITPESVTPVAAPAKSAPIPREFYSTTGQFSLVATDNCRIYQAPMSSSRILDWAPLTQRLHALSQHGEWVLVSYWDSPNQPLGWILRRNLAFPGDFNRIKDWEYLGFGCIRGDYMGEYRVNYNGTFTLHWRSKGQGLVMESSHKGVLYRYGPIIWAKGLDDGPWPKIFIVRDKHHIQNEALYNDYPVKFTE